MQLFDDLVIEKGAHGLGLAVHRRLREPEGAHFGILLDCKYYISREPWGRRRVDGGCCKNASWKASAGVGNESDNGADRVEITTMTRQYIRHRRGKLVKPTK